MSDQPSGRDEKGLTLSGRTMLRLLVEFGKNLIASRKLGDKVSYEHLQSPTVVLEIRSLLWIASQMAKRVGSREEIEAYLNKHAEADERTILEGLTKDTKTLLDEVSAHGGLKRCTCGEVICPICQECHTCNKEAPHENSNPFGFPDGGTLN